MKTLKNRILLVVAIVVSQNLFAREALTLEACREQAVAYNKELKNADYKIKEAEANQQAARTAYLPAFEVSANLMHSFEGVDVEVPGGFLPTAESAEAAAAGNFSGVSNVYSPGMSVELDHLSLIYGGLSALQPVYMGGKIQNLNKQADAGVAIANAGYFLKRSEVIELTDRTFWNVAMIESKIKLAETYIEMLTELEEQMTDMYEIGLTPKSEKLKVSVQKNEADLQLLKANNALRLSKMYLNQVLGRNLDTPVNIVYDSAYVDLFNMSDGLELALANREELKIMQKQVEIAGFRKNVTMADYKPQVGVSAQYTGAYVNDVLEDVQFRPMVAAQVKIPVFQWGQGRQKQQAANLQIKQAQTQLSNTTDLISMEVLQVKVQVEEAYEAILIAERNVAQAEESLDETKASFQVGLNTTTELLNAQADWQNALAQRISAIAEYKVLATSWQRVTGQLAMTK